MVNAVVKDLLPEVLHASSARNAVPAPPERGLVSLISLTTLTEADIPRVRTFQAGVRSRLDLTLVVVGGGYGCTRVIVKVIELEDEDPERLAAVLRKLLEGEVIREEARRVPFDVLITSEPYARRNLRTGEVDGGLPGVTINAKEVFVGNRYGDEFNVERAGIVGHGAHVVNFAQTWNDWTRGSDSPNLVALGEELSKLRQQLKVVAQTPEEDVATGAVARAEVAAKAGDGPGVLGALAAAGKWALQTAEKVGLIVAAAAIKKALGV